MPRRISLARFQRLEESEYDDRTRTLKQRRRNKKKKQRLPPIVTSSEDGTALESQLSDVDEPYFDATPIEKEPEEKPRTRMERFKDKFRRPRREIADNESLPGIHRVEGKKKTLAGKLQRWARSIRKRRFRGRHRIRLEQFPLMHRYRMSDQHLDTPKNKEPFVFVPMDEIDFRAMERSA